MGEKLQKLIERGVIDPDHADQLDAAVVAKIEATPMSDIETVINFYLEISPNAAMEPDPDGGFL